MIYVPVRSRALVGSVDRGEAHDRVRGKAPNRLKQGAHR
ncbi:hypothetical protein SBD_3420 [Streptomyces bottropensis ATCC 25435]|uniref:Uncharacterized protein n=1 Tax=Streptomyces bottropensis ATCC 25435 TaxID=1054862 RepID=M3DH89_9ACTN|nr:hypothetical protein SBD_3420 [Streptomyces bottropensis ATCC 25435]